MNELETEIERLRAEVDRLRKDLDCSACVELKTLPDEEVRAIILDVIKDLNDGDEVYPEDIALEHGIDLECVEVVMEKMLEEGFFR